MKRNAKGQRVFAWIMALLLTMGTISQNVTVAFAQETTSEQQETVASTETSEAESSETSASESAAVATETSETASTEVTTPAETQAAAEMSEAGQTEASAAAIKITFLIGEGEGVLSDTELTLSESDEVKPVKATPAEGYVFSGWTKTGDETFSEEKEKFTPVKENAEYVAHFTTAETDTEKTYNVQPIEGSENANGVTVSVKAPEGSFPEGTTLEILPIDQSKAEALVSDMDAAEAVAFDITFRDADGNKVQPQNGKTVSVTFSVSGSSDLTAHGEAAGELQIIHVGENGKEKLASAAAPENGSSAQINVNAGSFSPFVAVLRAPSGDGGTPQIVDATITDFRIERPQGTEVDHLNRNDSFYLAMDWKVRDENAILHEGDYFDIVLPDNMRFPPGYAQPDFDLLDEDGDVIAHAHVTPGSPDSSGGTIRVTFNDAINDNYNVHGTIYLGALFNKQETVDNEVNTFEVSVNGETETTQLTVDKVGLSPDYVIGKWGERVTEGGQITNKVKWYATINYRKSDMKNCIISDSLSGDTTYLQDTFRLRKVVYNDEGSVTSYGDDADLTGKLSFGGDNKSFTINLGNAGTDQYRLTYETTYTPGTEIRNNLRLQFDGEDKATSTKFQSSDAGGTVGGDIANKIRIIKVDADNTEVPLAGAVFEITRPDGTTFDLGPTGADGTVTSGVLTQGTYKAREKIAPVGYELNGEEFTLEVTAAGASIKVPDKKVTLDIVVNKVWDDHNNQDGKRPSNVTVQLQRNGEPYGDPVQLSEDNNWKKEFTSLPKYADDGTEYAYTVSETSVDGYTPDVTGSVVAGFTIKNTHVPETINISGSKTWNDTDNQDGFRPTQITIRLSDGENEQAKTVTAADNWEWSFSDLPKYKDGTEITYTITEDGVPGYTSAVDGYNVTNTHTPETINVQGSKTWEDKDNQDGIRPDTITIRLLANGTEKDSVDVNADDGWSWEFKDLPKYENGTEILYTITEDVIEDYTPEVNGYDVMNTHTPGKTSVTVTKSWNDNDDQDGIRPEKIIIHLLADGEDTGKTLELSAENSWTGSFADLDEKKNGQKIVYTVSEEKVTGYDEPAVSGDAVTGFVVTNVHKPETVELSGKKIWDDANNQDGVRPETITIRLLADGVEKDRKEVTESDHWSWKFSDLPKYRGGVEIKYTITEDAVAEYTSDIEGYDVTNKHTPGKTSVTVTKVWDDKDDQDGVRADSVTIHLLADGVDTGKTLVLNASNDWTGSFTDLDEKHNGKAIVYTVEEEEVSGYTVTITGNQTKGFTVTNVHTPKKPGKPDKPSKPDKPDTSRKPGTSPKTGDESNLMLWFSIMAVALLFLVLDLLYLRKRRKLGR